MRPVGAVRTGAEVRVGRESRERERERESRKWQRRIVWLCEPGGRGGEPGRQSIAINSINSIN